VIARGEVYWVDLRGAVGAEIRKTRPAVVVSRDKHNLYMDTVTVAPLSSGEVKVWFDEVPVPSGTLGDGRASRIKTHQIRAIDKNRVGRRIGRLPDELMAALDSSLRVHLAL
jgi:mRNA interferase MazF